MPNLSFEQIKDKFDRCVIGNYARNQVAFVHGEGSHVWDSAGDRYVDLMPGWGTTTIGHCHPHVVSAIQRQAGRLMHIDNSFYNIPQGVLAEHLSGRSFGGKCFFCNSGSEAIETSLKLSRLWGEKKGRFEIVTMNESFHGRTFGAISATGQEKYHRGYLPLLPGIKHVPFNDLDALKKTVGPNTCAVLMEPVQGEGGINVAGVEYMKAVRKFCDEQEILLIFDEVQTGVGRTCEWFGYQNYGIEPDIMVLAKALGGGFPVGAVVAEPEVSSFLAPGTHAATFGGNPLACAAAIAVLEVIEKENLLEEGRMVSQVTFERLEQMARKYNIIRQVRGMGLMIGIELEVNGKDIFEYCLQNKLRINCTQNNVLRLLPALNVPIDVLHAGLDVLESGIQKGGGAQI